MSRSAQIIDDLIDTAVAKDRTGEGHVRLVAPAPATVLLDLTIPVVPAIVPGTGAPPSRSHRATVTASSASISTGLAT